MVTLQSKGLSGCTQLYHAILKRFGEAVEPGNLLSRLLEFIKDMEKDNWKYGLALGAY
jgi:hypothetical protein